jgi:hypothetical protein
VLRAIAQNIDPQKRALLQKVALVACPNQGTPLANPARWGEAADLLVNWIPIDATGIAGKLAGFLAQLVARRIAGGVPGLAPMDSGSRNDASSLLYRLSQWGSDSEEYGTRFAVVAADYLAGRDARGSFALARQKAIEKAAEKLFCGPNDLVVDLDSHWKLASPSDPEPQGPVLRPKDILALIGTAMGANGLPAGASVFRHLDGVHHTNVFESVQTRDFLKRFLQG